MASHMLFSLSLFCSRYGNYKILFGMPGVGDTDNPTVQVLPAESCIVEDKLGNIECGLFGRLLVQKNITELKLTERRKEESFQEGAFNRKLQLYNLKGMFSPVSGLFLCSS